MNPLVSRRYMLGSGLALAGMAALPAEAATGKRMTFLVVGDWGRKGGAYQTQVARQMAVEAARIDAQFVISTGDNFYELGVSSPTDRHWDSSFYRIYDDPLLQRRWYPVLGNHDYGGNVFAQVKKTDPNGCWQMRDRSYTINLAREHGGPDVDLILYDSVAFHGGETLPFSLFGSKVRKEDAIREYDWLHDELARSTAPIKIVIGHHPIFSVGPHGGGGEKLARLDLLLRRYGVTAYVNGHDHCLYHIASKQMDYICSGGGSQELHQFTGDPEVSGCVVTGHCYAPGTAPPDVPVWLSYIDRAGFASFSVTDAALQFAFIDRMGLVRHTRTIPMRLPDLTVAYT